MPYNDEDDVLGTVNNSGGTYTLLDPGRYAFTVKAIKVVPNNFYKPGEVQLDKDGKEIKQNKEQFQVTFNVSDPASPDELFCEDNGDLISHTEWYGKRDDGVFTPKMRTYKLFASLMGSDRLADDFVPRKSELLGKRMLAVIAHKVSTDGKTVRGKIAKDTETPYAAPGARKFGTRAPQGVRPEARELAGVASGSVLAQLDAAGAPLVEENEPPF
jgi:hypothetical protein